MFGKSLFDLISSKRKQDFADSVGPSYDEIESTDPEGHEPPEHGFLLALRRKRKSALLKRMLSDGGNNELAKMVNVREY